jgi:hypothetical protein
MAVPLDAIRAIHSAFRKDLAVMDRAADAAARGQGDLSLVAKRHGFFNEILAWHATGEEKFVFPAVESVAPLVAEAYERDHRGLDALSESLRSGAVGHEPLTVSRATSAFHFFLDFHLNKEEAHLYRIFDERISLPDQGAIAGKMAQEIPPARFPEAVQWLYPLLGQADRENMTRIWGLSMPGPVFAGALKLIQASIGEDWAELTRRIPEIR